LLGICEALKGRLVSFFGVSQTPLPTFILTAFYQTALLSAGPICIGWGGIDTIVDFIRFLIVNFAPA